jgi:hypothetical protein
MGASSRLRGQEEENRNLEIFNSILSYIINLSSSKMKSLSLWKQPACGSAFQKVNCALITNGPIKMLNNFPKLLIV